MGEIGQKLCLRTAPEKSYARKVTVKLAIDEEVYQELFGELSHGRKRFDVSPDQLDSILPPGWLERAFQTSTKCVVSRQDPVTIRFANQRKVHYDHSECPRCQWSGDGRKPSLCQRKKTCPVDLSSLFVSFSRQRAHQEQAMEGMMTIWIAVC